MGATIQDAFYAPHDVASGAQAFLADNERLFNRRSRNEVAVVYGVEANRELVSRQDVGDNLVNARDESVVVPYRQVTEGLAGAAVPFDVVLFPDPRTAPDRVTAETLRRYATVILPSCTHLSPGQAAALRDYLDGGGTVVRVGGLGDNLPEADRRALARHPGVRTADAADVASLTPHGPQVTVSAQAAATGTVAVNTAGLVDGSTAVHLINYDYQAEDDRVRPIAALTLRVRLDGRPVTVTTHSCDGPVTTPPVEEDGEYHRVVLDALGAYTIVVFEPTTEAA